MNGKGQKTLRILIRKSKERVEIKANDDHPIVLIDGQLCAKQDCQTKLQEVTVHTAQMPGGKNQVDLHTKVHCFSVGPLMGYGISLLNIIPSQRLRINERKLHLFLQSCDCKSLPVGVYRTSPLSHPCSFSMGL